MFILRENGNEFEFGSVPEGYSKKQFKKMISCVPFSPFHLSIHGKYIFKKYSLQIRNITPELFTRKETSSFYYLGTVPASMYRVLTRCLAR